jgi:hypothetical protein
VLVLRTEQYRELQAASQTLPGVLSAVLQGRSVRVTLPAGADPEPVLGALLTQGFAFTPSAPELPSLEDFFVDLVNQDRATS